MVEEGAAIIDVGGESTRPGARAVGVQEELDRVLPVIEALHKEFETPISVDTSKPEVMREAVRAGAELINDVCALRGEGAVEAAASLRVPVCLMHMQGEPRTMQANPQYGDVVAEVRAFLAERVAVCERAGIPRRDLLIDPGFGFGKRVEHNLSLAKHLDEFQAVGVPVLVGVSRKSMFGTLLGVPAEARVNGSVALALLLAQRGAAIIRAHDVAPTVQALAVYRAVCEAE